MLDGLRLVKKHKKKRKGDRMHEEEEEGDMQGNKTF